MNQNTIFHVHTHRCHHASMEPDLAYVQKAIELSAEELVFTDHAPFPGNPFQGRMALKDLPEYMYTLQELKQRYANIIRIKIGLEIEYLPNYSNYYEWLKEQETFDLFLLGPHFSLMPDGSYSFQSKKKTEIVPYLAESLIAGMESGLFQAVAHPDQIFRYKKKWNPEFSSIAREIKECAADNRIVLEKNISNMLGKKNQQQSHRLYRPEFWQELPDDLQIIYGVDAHSVEEMEQHYLRLQRGEL